MFAKTEAPSLNRQARRQLAQEQRRAGNRRQPRNLNTMEVASHRDARLPAAKIEYILEPAVNAFKALREGVATLDQWGEIMALVSMALAVEKSRIVKGLAGHLQAAHDALDAVFKRVEDHPGAPAWGRQTTLYFDEIRAIGEAIDLHRHQLQFLSAAELDQIRAGLVKDVRARIARRESAAPVPHPTQEKLL